MRREGRTFRIIMQAAIKASEGTDVIILMDGHDYARNFAKKFGKMLSDYSIMTNPNTILFESGGTITFRARERHTPEKERGRLGRALLFNDHSCKEDY